METIYAYISYTISNKKTFVAYLITFISTHQSKSKGNNELKWKCIAIFHLVGKKGQLKNSPCITLLQGLDGRFRRWKSYRVV
jgi:hypothetical protein